MNKTGVCFAVLACVSMAGCAAWFPETKADQDKPKISLDSVQSNLDELTEKATIQSKFEIDEPWLVASEVKEHKRYPLMDEKQITISQYSKTLPQIMNRISDLLEVNVYLASDLQDSSGDDNATPQEMGGRESRTSAPRSLSMPKKVDTSSVMELIGNNSFGGEGWGGDPLNTEITAVSNGGTATALLDNIAAQLGISWKYSESRNRVTFYRLAQENFQVFFPGASETEIDVGKSGDRDSVINQKSKYKIDGGSWKEIAEGVQALLSTYGKATIVQSTGNVVVTDTPEAMENVADYIEKVNDIFGRQVYLQIRTVAVTVENTNDFNLSWSNILNTVNGGEFNLGTNSAPAPTNSLPNTFNVIRSSTGASLALEMLAAENQSTEINEQSVTTLSNQPTSLKVLTETGYISGVSQQDLVNNNNSNVVSDVQTDTVKIGFDATLLPRVISKTSLQLQVALELSSNLSLTNFDSTIVQTPTRDRNSVVQRAWLKNGETWVLAAFNSEKTQDGKQGTGSAGFWGLGGGTSKGKSNQVLLVLITPHIQGGVF